MNLSEYERPGGEEDRGAEDLGGEHGVRSGGCEGSTEDTGPAKIPLATTPRWRVRKCRIESGFDTVQPMDPRCTWCLGDELYEHYHDHEWGVPCRDETTLFEMLNLEGAQAGLSWITILRKRENYRRAFAGFDKHKMARF